jgi:apolipoprotein N-acyltransferase
MLFGILPDLGIVGNAFGFVYGLVLAVPYLIDRVLARRHNGFLSTLAFPTALVLVEYLLSIWDMTGSWFSIAYTQRDNLPLIQLVSVTGLWGVTFLVSWFASVVNWIWENDFDLAEVWKGGVFYIGVLALAHVFGGAYLAFVPNDAPTVRVAGITRSFDMDIEARKCQHDVPCLRRLFDTSLAEFLTGSKRVVDGGAKIVLWQENGVAVYATDEARFVRTAREFAIREGVYLLMGMKVVAQQKTDDENKAVLVSPQGEVLEYFKNYRSPGDEHLLGDGKILISQSSFGMLGALICKDFDYPSFVRNAGSNTVDIMLIPSHDWQAINPHHARMAHFRAIENGYSMISANYHGTSTAVDFHGRALGHMNGFTTDERTYSVDIPTRGVRTVYSVIGDLLAWLCGSGLAALIFAGRRPT